MATNGGIRIPVELETKLVERQLNALRERIQEIDEQAEKALEAGDVDYYNRLTEQANELRREESEIVDLKLRQARQAERLSKEMQNQTEYQKTTTSEIDRMSVELEQMVSDYNLMKKQKIISEQDIEDAEQLKKDILELVRQIEKLSGKKVTIPGITDQGGEQAKDNTRNLDLNFKKLLKSAKRLALGILGIRGAYMLARKAANAWMSTDEQKAKDMENNWVALGTILSGVIETLMKGFRKLVTGILYFMSVLTGTNYIQKANDAILKKQTKSTNELAKANQKLTASFDELNVLQENSNASGNQDNTTGSLIDVNDIGVKARSTIEKIAEVLRPVYEMIKDVVKWAIDHPEALIGILGGAVLLSFLGKVLGVAGVGGAVGTGLAGIYGVLLALLAIGTITISIITIYKAGKDLAEADNANKKATNDLTERTKELNETTKEKIELGEYDEETTKKLTDITKSRTTSTYESAKAMQKENKEGGLLSQTINSLTGHHASNQQQINKSIQAVKSNIEVLKAEGDKYEWTEERLRAYKEQLSLLVDLTDDSVVQGNALGITYDTLGKMVDFTGEEIDETNGGMMANIKWNKEARDEIKETNRKLGDTDSWLDKIKSKIAEVNGKRVTIDVDFNTNTNKLSDRLAYVAGQLNLSTFNTIANTLRRVGLASGGIVNLPGRGVPLGNVVTGEVSAEGVIPLTDEQAMETMGRAIGRHVTIPVTVINQMNGRTISRELQVVQGDSDFAYNR